MFASEPGFVSVLLLEVETTYVSKYGNHSLGQCTRNIRLYRETSFEINVQDKSSIQSNIPVVEQLVWVWLKVLVEAVGL